MLDKTIYNLSHTFFAPRPNYSSTCEYDNSTHNFNNLVCQYTLGYCLILVEITFM